METKVTTFNQDLTRVVDAVSWRFF